MIQDDAIVCERFASALRLAVAARPDRMLVLFVGGQPYYAAENVKRAVARGEPWAVLDGQRWMPAVAVVWPTRLIEPALAFVDSKEWPATFRADDEIIGQAVRHLGEHALATVPSLVQHPDDVPSLVSRRARHGRDPGRVAACFASDDCDATLIDWARGPA